LGTSRLVRGWPELGQSASLLGYAIVGAIFHFSDDERYRRLNDVVCPCVGEVRAPTDPEQQEPDLVLDVAEPIWEPILD
jgi:hypothetical protein